MAVNQQSVPDNMVPKVISIALLFMLIGTALELYLLGHYEDVEQLIPLLCIGACLVGAVALYLRPTAWVARIFKWVLLLTALGGVYGTYLHIKANVEFELEMKPGLEGSDLWMESLTGAMPALAPASMVVLSLIGYSYYLLIKPRK